MKLSDVGRGCLNGVPYWNVGSCLPYGGDLMVIVQCNICDAPRGFSNNAEANCLECFYGSSF